MALDPFAAPDRYVRFLGVQQAFHHAIAPLYAVPALQALIPDLAARDRSVAIAADLRDVALTPPALPDTPAIAADDLPTALGWLYVAEGSALGAAFLIKAAQHIGFDADHGARHLAGHADGRAAHWRRFTARIDAVTMNDAEEQRMIEAARAAFARFRALIDAAFA